MLSPSRNLTNFLGISLYDDQYFIDYYPAQHPCPTSTHKNLSYLKLLNQLLILFNFKELVGIQSIGQLILKMARPKSNPISAPVAPPPNNSIPKTVVESGLSFDSASAGLLQAILTIFKIISAILMSISYCLLMFQTVYVLNSKQPKYINLRHLALKWLACLCLHQLKQGFASSSDVNSQMTMILLQILIIAIAYPSKILKAVHLKYFSHKEQQRYQQSVTDPNKYDLSFSGRFCISLSVILLTFCKHLIALVLPQHRRPIQDALRSINGVVIDRKCFWSIYNNNNQIQMYEKQRLAVKQYLVSGTTLQNSSSPMITSLTGIDNVHRSMEATTPLLPKKQGRDIIKAYGEKCSNIIANGFKPVKRVTIKYSMNTSQIQILDMDFGRSETYILEQLSEKESSVLEFIVLAPGNKLSEPIYIKFKNSREAEQFMREIQQAQKAF